MHLSELKTQHVSQLLEMATSISFDVAISSSWLTCCVLSSDKCIKSPSGMSDLRPFERKTGNRNGEDLRLDTAPCRRRVGGRLNVPPAFCVKNRDFRCCCQEMR